ncbi:MAG: hypothetical protein OHK006_03360 [Thermodesulfovibrionales bacterium]
MASVKLKAEDTFVSGKDIPETMAPCANLKITFLLRLTTLAATLRNLCSEPCGGLILRKTVNEWSGRYRRIDESLSNARPSADSQTNSLAREQ